MTYTPKEYGFSHSRPNPSHAYLWPVIADVIRANTFPEKRAIDIGCGNGVTANMLREHGFDVVAIDPSATGIANAKKAFPGISFHQASAYDDLVTRYGQFPLAISLEVIEHLVSPASLCRTLRSVLSPGGIGVISTPYHGYWKNLAIAVSGKWDRHHHALREEGHIKFLSMPTLRALLESAGFEDISFRRVGRIPPLARSMVAIVRK